MLFGKNTPEGAEKAPGKKEMKTLDAAGKTAFFTVSRRREGRGQE